MTLPRSIFTTAGEEIPFMLALDITTRTLGAIAHHHSMSADPENVLFASLVRSFLKELTNPPTE